MRVTVLGSGTSNGVPVIGCSCSVCTSRDPRDIRFRSSVFIQSENTSVLIDTAPEFRLQAIKAGIRSLNTVLYTHTHADHVHGLDDIRPLTKECPIELYGTSKDMRSIKNRFDYAFKKQKAGGGVPNIELKAVRAGSPFTLGNLPVTALGIRHGKQMIYGYRIRDFVYITDCSFIPEKTFEHLNGIKVLIIGALRERPHPTHFSFDQAISLIEKINPGMSYFTHICHIHSHKEISAYIKRKTDKKIEPAYDGLSFSV